MGERRVQQQTRLQQRREKVRALHFKGLGVCAIARQVGSYPTTVRRDLEYWNRQWRAGLPLDGIQLLAEELERLNFLASEAWKGWERSQLPATVETMVVEEGRGEPKQKAQKTTRSQVGNVHFLELIARVSLRRCQLLNLEQVELTDEPISILEGEFTSSSWQAMSSVAEEQRQLAVAKDSYAGPVRLYCEPGPLDDGEAPGGAGSGADGPGAGTPVEVDRTDATETWEI